MITECPHCHRTVMTRDDGECPACNKNTTETSGLDLNTTLLYVSQATSFPDICCTCRAHTGNRVVITGSGQTTTATSSGDRSSASLAAVFLVLFAFLGSVVLLIARLFTGPATSRKSVRTTLTIEVPQCDMCSAERQVETASVDVDNYELGIVVDREFAAIVRSANSR